MADDKPAEFYWCLTHKRVESTPRCGSALLMGPYETEEQARQYAETAAARDDAWQKEDEEWHGTP